MATDLGQLVYTLTLEDQGFQGQLGSASSKVKESSGQMTGSMQETEKQSSRLGSAFSSMAGQFVIGSAIFTVAQKAVSFLTSQVHEGVKAFEQWQINQAQLQNALKTTGDASGQSVKGLNEYAETLSKQTAISGNAINSAQLVMLNYKAIGKDIFPQTTKAVADFATVLSHGAVPTVDEMNAAAKKLGTALSDPEHGMARLKIAGIVLNDQQKEHIKTMQESGNLLGAQKLLLSDVADVIGGKAATASHTLAGEQARLKEQLEDVQIAIGQKLTAALKALEPVLSDILSWFTKIAGSSVIRSGMRDIGDAFRYVEEVVKLFFEALRGGDPTISAAQAKFAGIAKIMGDVQYYFGEVRTAIKLLFEVIRGGDPTLDENHLQMAGFVVILDKAKIILTQVAETIKTILLEAWRLLKTAIDLLLPSIEALFRALVSNIVPIFKELFNTLIRVYNAVSPALMDVLKVLAVIVGVTLYVAIYLFINTLRIAIQVLAFAVHAITDVVGWIANLVGWFGTAIVAVGHFSATVIYWFSTLPGTIRNAVSGFGRLLVQAGSDLIDGLINGVKGAAGRAVDAVKNVGKDMVNGVKSVLKVFSPSQVFSDIGANVVLGLAGGISDKSQQAVQATKDMASSVVQAGAALPSTINNSSSSNVTGPTYNFGPGSVTLSTPEAVDRFFSIGNRNIALELAGGSPLAGTAGV